MISTHIDRAAVALAIGTCFAGAMIGGTLLAPSAYAGPFDQRDFPCQEDEVLAYAPEFGPDHVGCIHVELISDGHGRHFDITDGR